MDKMELHSVQTRLTALERKVSRYRNAVVLLLVVLAGVVLIGASTDDVHDAPLRSDTVSMVAFILSTVEAFPIHGILPSGCCGPWGWCMLCKTTRASPSISEGMN